MISEMYNKKVRIKEKVSVEAMAEDAMENLHVVINYLLRIKKKLSSYKYNSPQFMKEYNKIKPEISKYLKDTLEAL
jgi:hypothetical protein